MAGGHELPGSERSWKRQKATERRGDGTRGVGDYTVELTISYLSTDINSSTRMFHQLLRLGCDHGQPGFFRDLSATPGHQVGPSEPLNHLTFQSTPVPRFVVKGSDHW